VALGVAGALAVVEEPVLGPGVRARRACSIRPAVVGLAGCEPAIVALGAAGALAVVEKPVLGPGVRARRACSIRPAVVGLAGCEPAIVALGVAGALAVVEKPVLGSGGRASIRPWSAWRPSRSCRCSARCVVGPAGVLGPGVPWLGLAAVEERLWSALAIVALGVAGALAVVEELPVVSPVGGRSAVRPLGRAAPRRARAAAAVWLDRGAARGDHDQARLRARRPESRSAPSLWLARTRSSTGRKHEHGHQR
jgi:hypothetical protein